MKALSDEQEPMDEIAVLCGGRAAEELIFGEMTNWRSMILSVQQQLLAAMVTQHGMSDKLAWLPQPASKAANLGGGSSSSPALRQQLVLRSMPEAGALLKRATSKRHSDAKENCFACMKCSLPAEERDQATGERLMNILKRENTFAPVVDNTELYEALLLLQSRVNFPVIAIHLYCRWVVFQNCGKLYCM